MAAAAIRKPCTGPRPSHGCVFPVPTSPLPRLVTARQFSLWKYFCIFLTQGRGRDPAEINQSLPCCSGVRLAQARAMTTDWGRSTAGSPLWGTPETIHGESRLEYWKEMMTLFESRGAAMPEATPDFSIISTTTLSLGLTPLSSSYRQMTVDKSSLWY